MIRHTVKDESTKVEGEIVYNEDPKVAPVQYTLLVPNRALASKLNKYFNKERVFWVPESQKIDDYRRDVEKPIKHVMYFEMALTELGSLGLKIIE